MRVAIDRFEGDTAVCQDLDTKRMIDLPRAKLPQEAREGSILVIDDESISLDVAGTTERAKRIKKKMDELWE